MTNKLTIAITLLGLLMPAVAVSPQEPQSQLSPEGLFYSSGRSYLGVEVRDITSDRVSALKLKEERGVEITMVDQDAPAGKAGLKEHDVIVEYNGTRVESEEQFRRMIRETPPGRTVTLGISRDGNPMTITAQIGDRGKLSSQLFKNGRNNTFLFTPPASVPQEFNFPFDVQVLTYAVPLGIQTENLNQQLGEYFGVKDGGGILVKSVEKGSAAEKAGMKAGDVITRADNEKISDRSDLRRILRSHRSGGKVTLGIIRDKHEQNLVIDLPARGSDDSSGLRILAPDVESFDDWKSTLREMGPEINDLIHDNLQRMRPELLQAQDALRQITPEVQERMREFQSEMQHWGKDLQRAAKEWRRQCNDLI
jgi:predicted metalloprotease with PDZ domain